MKENKGEIKVTGCDIEETFNTNHIIVDYSQAGPGDMSITMTDNDPSVPAHLRSKKDSAINIDFDPPVYHSSLFLSDIPTSPGSHSPFPLKVVPSCDQNGNTTEPGLKGGNTTQVFSVEIRSPREGGFGLTVEGPSEATMTCRVPLSTWKMLL